MTARDWPVRPRVVERLLCEHGLSRTEARRAMHYGLAGLTDMLDADPDLRAALAAAEAADRERQPEQQR